MSKFDEVIIKKPKRSTHSLSHNVGDTYNIGDLNLLYVRRCTPTEYVRMKWNTLIKFNPLLAPAFAHMKFKTWAFFVPTSQIDNTFQSMIQNVKKESETIVENGIKQIENTYKVPYITPYDISLLMDCNYTTNQYGDIYQRRQSWNASDAIAVGKLANQIGLPLWLTTNHWSKIGVPNPKYTALRSYYGDDFKQIDVQLATVVGGSSWPVDLITEMHGQEPGLYTNTKSGIHLDLNVWRAYQHVWNEYFRDSKREEKVDLYRDLNGSIFGDGGALSEFVSDYGANPAVTYNFANNVLRLRKVCYSKDYFNTASTDPTLGADSISLPSNITGLRKANSLQKFLEKKALGGNRFADFLLMHFGQTANNYELDRPIYLGHSEQPIQISETLQTSESTQQSAQGTRTGNANSFGQSNGFAFNCMDYGYVIVLGALVPDITYYQGINRKLVVNDWESFPFPEFANIGMQDIKYSELFFEPYGISNNNESLNNSTFGYAPRYIEFKHELNRLQGDFAAPWLNYWHQSPDFLKLQQDYNYKPLLNYNFSKVGLGIGDNFNPQFDAYYNRIFAITDDRDNHTQCQTYFDISVNSPLPANEMPHL